MTPYSIVFHFGRCGWDRVVTDCLRQEMIKIILCWEFYKNKKDIKIYGNFMSYV